jgi:predicted restriction endonuclease
MSNRKKEVRKNFRDACFKRDKYSCVLCDFKADKDNAENVLDAHHITDRTEMPNGGYVKENGISLCEECHKKAEEFHSTGISVLGFSPEDLYQKIGSSKEKALEASKKIG